MFPKLQLTNIQHYPKAINRGQAIIWTNDGLVHWHIYVLLSLDEFKHWNRDKMADIFQTTFSSAFSWMKMYEFW